MEKRRGIKVLLFLLAFVGCFSLLPQQLWAKSKEMTISQADVYLPDISVYMETADGKACGKDEVKAKISDTGVSLTVKSSDIFSDTDRGIYYHVLLDISTSIRADQFDAMKKSILALKKKIRKKDRLSVITFGKEVKEAADGNSSYGELSKVLSKIKQEKGTHLYEGINTITEQVNAQKDKEIKKEVKAENSMRNIGIILTDWQEIKDAGGITSQEESLKSLQETGTPLYGFCLKTAKDTLQDDMGAFLRKTGGSFQIFNEGKKDTQLTDLNKERLKDNVLLIHSSSNKTYDEEKVLELEAGEETVKKEHLYLNRAQSDSKKPTITSVKQKGKDAKTIVVTFSEDVLSADNKNNYSILRGGKHTYTVSEATYTSDNEKYQAKLVLNDKLVKGKYTVETHNIVDNTNEENPLDTSWSGELDGEGAFKAFYTSLGKFWAIILAIIVFAVLLGIYLYIRKHRGIMVVQDKMVLGDKMEQKKHIKSDQSTTKNVILSVSGIAADEKEMAVQINGSIIIGRASFCDIYFDDLKMSGQHFALLVQKGGIFLSDLNSTNGTFVDGKPVEAGPEVTVPVANGSTIEAGSVTFVIRW